MELCNPESSIKYDPSKKLLTINNAFSGKPWWQLAASTPIPEFNFSLDEMVSYQKYVARYYDWLYIETSKGSIRARFNPGKYGDILDILSQTGREVKVNIFNVYVLPSLVIFAIVLLISYLAVLVMGKYGILS